MFSAEGLRGNAVAAGKSGLIHFWIGLLASTTGEFRGHRRTDSNTQMENEGKTKQMRTHEEDQKGDKRRLKRDPRFALMGWGSMEIVPAEPTS